MVCDFVIFKSNRSARLNASTWIPAQWKPNRKSPIECEAKISNNFKHWCECICHLNWIWIRIRLSKFYLSLTTLFHLINWIFSHWPRSDVVHNVKLVKTKKLFAFPKKSKHSQSNSAKSTNPPFNVSHFLTAVSLAQIQQMISFLMFDQSNFYLFLSFRPIWFTNFPFVLQLARAQTSFKKAYSVGPAQWLDKMSWGAGWMTTIHWISTTVFTQCMTVRAFWRRCWPIYRNHCWLTASMQFIVKLLNCATAMRSIAAKQRRRVCCTPFNCCCCCYPLRIDRSSSTSSICWKRRPNTSRAIKCRRKVWPHYSHRIWYVRANWRPKRCIRYRRIYRAWLALW